MSDTAVGGNRLAVDVRHVTHHFGRRAALDGVDLSVREGEIAAMLGPNGSGKTTLFRILATLARPQSGALSIFGHDLSAAPDEVRKCLGVVFQQPALDPILTVEENLRHHGRLYGLRGADLTRRCRNALASLEVADRARDRVGTLSGGLRRRVEIAKVLTHDPRLLLLDEPSAGLDPKARAGLLTILQDLRSRLGTTVLMTTHFMEEADRCDRVAIMDAGRVVAFDEPGRLKQRVDGAAVALRVMTHPTLEDVFVNLTGHGFDEMSA